MQSPQAQTASEAAHLRAFALNALRAMVPALKEQPEFCNRVLQHTDYLRNEPDLLDALTAALKENGMPLPGAGAVAAGSTIASPGTPGDAVGAANGAGVSATDQALQALPAASALPGAAPDKGPPPGLQRRRTEPMPGTAATTPNTSVAVNSGEQEASTPHPELFSLAKARKAAARLLWQNV